MKRIVLLLIAFIFFFEGCSGRLEDASNMETHDSSIVETERNFLADPLFDTAEYLAAYDVDNSVCFPMARLCETEGAYYGLCSSIMEQLMYMDKGSGVSGVLCAKAECEHNAESCNAYVGLGAGGFSVYDGCLYWVGDQIVEKTIVTGLWSMNLDGTDRVKIKDIDVELLNATADNSIIRVHRGYLYLIGCEGVIENGKTITRVTAQATPLDSSDEWVTILDLEVDSGVTSDVKFVGNKVYIMIEKKEAENRILTLYVWDSKTRELSICFEENISFHAENMWVEEEGAYFAASGASIGLYKFDFEKKTLEFCFGFEDPQYFGIEVGDNIAVGLGMTEHGDRLFWVKDFEGNTIYQEIFEVTDIENMQELGWSYVGGNQKHIFIALQSREVQYMIEVPLAGGQEERILWKYVSTGETV
ncbi:MAG: hypothetical protein IJ315_05160 [Firmicutes bacterium]|nr:hypothetical protein [Bacillota bacterium]